MYEDSEDSSVRQLVAFFAGRARYGAPIEAVLEMTSLGPLETIAGVGQSVLGMMQLREEVIPIVELRSLMGIPARSVEIERIIEELLAQQKAHDEWTDQIARFAESGGRSPKHVSSADCPLRRWERDARGCDDSLERALDKLSNLHKGVHAFAHAVSSAVERGDSKAAKTAVATAYGGPWRDLSEWFEETIRTIGDAQRQMVVVLTVCGRKLGLAVDRIDSVVSFEPADVRPGAMEGLVTSPLTALVSSVIRPGNGSKLIQLLDPESLVASLRPRAADRDRDPWEGHMAQVEAGAAPSVR